MSNIGPIHLSGLQVQEATSRIKRAFSRIYSDLASAHQPGTFIGVSHGYTRTIQINVMGEVAVLGTYALSSVATLPDFAGGFKGKAYKKNFLVKRKGVNELKVYTIEAGEYSSFKIMDVKGRMSL